MIRNLVLLIVMSILPYFVGKVAQTIMDAQDRPSTYVQQSADPTRYDGPEYMLWRSLNEDTRN